MHTFWKVKLPDVGIRSFQPSCSTAQYIIDIPTVPTDLWTLRETVLPSGRISYGDLVLIITMATDISYHKTIGTESEDSIDIIILQNGYSDTGVST